MRAIVPLALVLFATATASAGPLGWTYNVAFLPFGNGENYMLVGVEEERSPPDANTSTWHNLFLDVRQYAPASGTVADGTWQSVYTFGPETPLLSWVGEHESTGSWFDLSVTLTDAAGHTATVSPTFGAIGVHDFTEGKTPRYVVHLSGEQEVTLGGRRAKVSFGADGAQYTGQDMRFRVDEEPIGTPEPGTIILAGLAVSAGLGAWARRKLARSHA